MIKKVIITNVPLEWAKSLIHLGYDKGDNIALVKSQLENFERCEDMTESRTKSDFKYEKKPKEFKTNNHYAQKTNNNSVNNNKPGQRGKIQGW